MSLRSAISTIKSIKQQYIVAAKVMIDTLQHDIDHGNLTEDSFNVGILALQTIQTDNVGAFDFEYPTVTVSTVEYVITAPTVKFEGVEYTAEDIADDAVLAAAMIAAGVSFIVRKVVANFTATPLTGTHAVTAIHFTDTSTNSPTEWLWDFGDDNTSTERNPIHTYLFAGSFDVTLTARTKYCEDVKVRIGYVVIS